MKIKFLMTGLLGFISVAALAQKGELNNAKDKYDKYNIESANKLTQKQGNDDLNDAKTSIDKASTNEKTANLPLTWAVKGSIYSALTLKDSVPATALPNFKIADEALAKAKSLDSAKNENKDMIHKAYLNLAQYSFDKGRVEFQNKKFVDSYKDFDYFRQVLPDDTTALYVTGLSAANAGITDAKYNAIALTSYKKLIATNYSKNPEIYQDMASIYITNKDTASAFKIAGEGVAKYPNNNDLRKREIEIGLQSGKQDVLISKIEVAIAADPKNKTLYYYEGLTYSQIAEAYATQQKKTKVAAEKSALQQKKIENFGKAAEQYKKAVAIDPNYFEANLNLGYVLISPAIDEYNAANQLPASKQKEYDAAVAKAKADFAAAKPYLQKATELNPKSVDALNNLKTYYLGMQDTANANATQKKIEALGASAQ